MIVIIVLYSLFHLSCGLVALGRDIKYGHIKRLYLNLLNEESSFPKVEAVAILTISIIVILLLGPFVILLKGVRQ